MSITNLPKERQVRDFLAKGAEKKGKKLSFEVISMRYLKLFCFAALILLPLHAGGETLTYAYDSAGRLTGAALNYGVDITYVYDVTGNRSNRIVTIEAPEAGDMNNDGAINLDDAVLTLQLLSGVMTETPVCKAGDINSNNRIDLAETLWILRTIAGL